MRTFVDARASQLVLALTIVGALAPSTAWAAPDKKACLEAYEETQKLKKAGKLLEAKKRALVCAQSECATVVRDDCTSWSVELDKTIPSIVLVVTDADGKDITDAKAFIDGEEVSSHKEGKAILLDPGSHKLRVERIGFDTIEQEVVAHEGDKNRSITVKFPKKGGDEPTKTTPEPPAGDGPKTTTMVAKPIPGATWVLLGVGVVGLAGFATFGVMGKGKKSDLDASGCKPACSSTDVDAAKKDFLIADIALGVGVVSLGVAAVLALTRGQEPAPGTAKLPAVDVAVGKSGASAALSWSF